MTKILKSTVLVLQSHGTEGLGLTLSFTRLFQQSTEIVGYSLVNISSKRDRGCRGTSKFQLQGQTITDESINNQTVSSPSYL